MLKRTKDTCSVKKSTSRLAVKGKVSIQIYAFYSDGPAVWVNDTLDRGQTNRCLTFESDMLTLGEKDKDEQFEIHNMEFYLL